MSSDRDWSWHATLNGTTEVETGTDSEVTFRPANEYRFGSIAGSTAWIPQDPRSTIKVPFDGWSDTRAGTITAWVSPLEDIASWTPVNTDVEDEEGFARLPVFADAFPRRNISEAGLALTIYPGTRVGLCANGGRGSGYLPEYVESSRPIVRPDDPETTVTQAALYQPAFPVTPGLWYHVGMSWDLDRGQIEMYVNGERINVGHDRAFTRPGETLFFGNPLLALADVRASDRQLPPSVIAETFEQDRERHERPLDEATTALREGVEYDPIEIDRETYTLQREYDLTDPDEVEQFVQHGPDNSVLNELRATPEGLLFETPDGWEYQDCATLWAPGRFEGDQLIECEFRIERPEGLALLIFNASTFERGDVIDHREYPVTGRMGPLIYDIRSYWWEFFRRTPPARTDPDSHILLKGAYGYPPLDDNVSSLPERGTWHTLTISKEGDRIRGAIDGQTIVEADESAFPANGPSLNCGRIGIRHMQQTRIRYRNLRVFSRTPAYLEYNPHSPQRQQF